MAVPSIQVVFVHHSGRREPVSAQIGRTVMDAALDNGVDGIVAQCGGARTCATCHCHIDLVWHRWLPELHEDEVELLTFVLRPDARSRLACQVPLTEELNGIVVHLPEYQQ